MMLGPEDYHEEYLSGQQLPGDFARVKVGAKTYENPIANVGLYKKVDPRATKEKVLRSIKTNDYKNMREISDFFYRSSGIYARLCRYLAYLYRYDYYVTPIVIGNAVKNDKIIEGFHKSLDYLDNFHVKQFCDDAALKAIKLGCYYGYKIQQDDTTEIQELPVAYCRSRFFVGGKPLVEFNVKFFDDYFSDPVQRIKMLKTFPTEFAKGYMLYKEGKLPKDFVGDMMGWYPLDIKNTVKFNLNGSDYPLLIAIIPAIIDLDEAKELDRKKMEQDLLKIIVQKIPLDKNGELLFDVDESTALHNNVVRMLGDAIGVDVLTTFAEIDIADMSDKGNINSNDKLQKVERAVYNEAGVSEQQFNATGNIALTKSINNDEASIENLLGQFELFLNELLEPFNKNKKKLYYKAEFLPTTIYNYQDLSDKYQAQMQNGFSKIFPQLALGQSQSSILAIAFFENEVLKLNDVFVPPQNSSTMSSAETTPKTAASAADPTKKVGRVALPEDKKTDKTIQNNESM